MLPPRALTNASISEKATDAVVGLAKTVARVFRCLEFTGTCYHFMLALDASTCNRQQHWRDDSVMVNAGVKPQRVCALLFFFSTLLAAF